MVSTSNQEFIMSALSDALLSGIASQFDDEKQAAAGYLKTQSAIMAEQARSAQLDSMDRIRKMLSKAKDEGADDVYINALQKLMPTTGV